MTKNKQIKQKLHHLRLFKFKHTFLKISVELQPALAAQACLVEGQRLKEQLNREVGMFQPGRQVPTVSIISTNVHIVNSCSELHTNVDTKNDMR
jgi:hypothetical protein